MFGHHAGSRCPKTPLRVSAPWTPKDLPARKSAGAGWPRPPRTPRRFAATPPGEARRPRRARSSSPAEVRSSPLWASVMPRRRAQLSGAGEGARGRSGRPAERRPASAPRPRAVGFRHDVHAVVHPVDEIHVQPPGGPNMIAAVGSGPGAREKRVAFAEIGLDLDDAGQLSPSSRHQHFADQLARHRDGRPRVERAGQGRQSRGVPTGLARRHSPRGIERTREGPFS